MSQEAKSLLCEVRSNYTRAEVQTPAAPVWVLRTIREQEHCGEGRQERAESPPTENGCFLSKLAFSYLGIRFVHIVLASAGGNNEVMAALMDDAGAH